jgi:hypothetical protein
MIFNALALLVAGAFDKILSFFPDCDPLALDILHNGLYALKEQAAGYNWIFPVAELYWAFNAAIILMALIAFVRLVRWIASILTVGAIK